MFSHSFRKAMKSHKLSKIERQWWRQSIDWAKHFILCKIVNIYKQRGTEGDFFMFAIVGRNFWPLFCQHTNKMVWREFNGLLINFWDALNRLKKNNVAIRLTQMRLLINGSHQPKVKYPIYNRHHFSSSTVIASFSFLFSILCLCASDCLIKAETFIYGKSLLIELHLTSQMHLRWCAVARLNCFAQFFCVQRRLMFS